MPVFTTNSNAIPVNGADRVEILRDGASAIYGADALAGVVNTVLKSNFVGTRVRLKLSGYEHFSANDQKLSVQWGQDFDNTNVSVYFDAFRRAEIRGNEDPKWLAQDARVSPGLGKFVETLGMMFHGEIQMQPHLLELAWRRTFSSLQDYMKLCLYRNWRRYMFVFEYLIILDSLRANIMKLDG